MTDRICDTSHNNTVALNTSHNNTVAFITQCKSYTLLFPLESDCHVSCSMALVNRFANEYLFLFDIWLISFVSIVLPRAGVLLDIVRFLRALPGVDSVIGMVLRNEVKSFVKKLSASPAQDGRKELVRIPKEGTDNDDGDNDIIVVWLEYRNLQGLYIGI